MLFLCGQFEQARALRKDLLGELKVACIELYQRQEHDLALRYAEEYLQSDPTDFEVKFHKARCLSRLEKPDEARRIIDELMQVSVSRRRKARLHFARGRTYLEKREVEKPGDLEAAKSSFLNAIELSPDYVPALQGIAEIFIRNNAMDEAAGFLQRALKVSPMDSFALSLHAEVLWRQGKHEDAIKAMELVIKAQPQNATFLFRLGRFLQGAGKPEKAYDLFKTAKQSDNSYWDARLSLANVAIDLGKLDEAREEIDTLRTKLTGEKRRILDSIEAGYEVARGNLDEARKLAGRTLAQARDVVSLGLMAKIEIAFYRKTLAEGTKVLAESHKGQALKLLEEGLAMDPSNPPLLRQKEIVQSLGTTK